MWVAEAIRHAHIKHYILRYNNYTFITWRLCWMDLTILRLRDYKLHIEISGNKFHTRHYFVSIPCPGEENKSSVPSPFVSESNSHCQVYEEMELELKHLSTWPEKKLFWKFWHSAIVWWISAAKKISDKAISPLNTNSARTYAYDH